MSLIVFRAEKEIASAAINFLFGCLVLTSLFLPWDERGWLQMLGLSVCVAIALLCFWNAWIHGSRGFSGQNLLAIGPEGLTLPSSLCRRTLDWSEITDFVFDKQSYGGANDCQMSVNLKAPVRSLRHPMGSAKISLWLGEDRLSILETESAMGLVRDYLRRQGWKG
jgi:hypothetical protein